MGYLNKQIPMHLGYRRWKLRPENLTYKTNLHNFFTEIKKYSNALHRKLLDNFFKLCISLLSRDQNAGRSYSMKIDNSSIERVEEFKYLGTKLTNQNYIQEEIKS